MSVETETRDIVGVRGREVTLEQAVDHRRLHEWNPITSRKEFLEARRAADKRDLKILDSFPVEDPHANGTVITWATKQGWRAGALKHDDTWYLTSSTRSYPWGDVVVDHLARSVSYRVTGPDGTSEEVVFEETSK